MALVRHRGFMSSGQSFGVPSDASFASSSSSYVHQATILMSSGTSVSSYSSSPSASDPDKPVGYGAFGVVWCVRYSSISNSNLDYCTYLDCCNIIARLQQIVGICILKLLLPLHPWSV